MFCARIHTGTIIILIIFGSIDSSDREQQIFYNCLFNINVAYFYS